ncbi:MAG: hypothetical protein AAF790_10545 [Planctomycetota bacterium]
MQRLMTALALAAVTVCGAAQLGCRACGGNCYDYAPPVADCHCNACGGGRSGSIMPGGYAADGSSSGQLDTEHAAVAEAQAAGDAYRR